MRFHIYRTYAQELVNNGHAYRCFCGPERLHALHQARRSAGLPTEYDRTCLTIGADESASRAAAKEPHVVRLLSPPQYPGYRDAVYGPIEFAGDPRAQSLGSFEDPILLKSNLEPTYHLASVVDDHLMKITHVCRGQEWIPSTPKHVHLYNRFGWTPPQFLHVGLLQGSAGSKLSKRHGDTFVSDYRKKGYLPEALLNFVALLGWSHDLPSDVMTLEEMADQFSIDRLTTGSAVVNMEKLGFLQTKHVAARLESGHGLPMDLIMRVGIAVRDRFGKKCVRLIPIVRQGKRADMTGLGSKTVTK